MDSSAEIKVHKKPSFTTIVGIVLLLVAVLFAILMYYAKQYGTIASGYMARQMCSCLYVQGREETSCLKDMEAGIGSAAKYTKLVYFPEKVIANFWGIASAQAELSPGQGCAVRAFNGAMPNGLDIVPE